MRKTSQTLAKIKCIFQIKFIIKIGFPVTQFPHIISPPFFLAKTLIY